MALKPLKEIGEWWELCARYRYDIYGFAVEALGVTPTWQQQLLFESIQFDGSRTSITSGHGCFGKGTLIMLADGTIKPVEQIKINDKLMGGDGSSVREVLSLSQGRENMYQFTYADGTSHIFNESHILCLVATNSQHGNPTGTKLEVSVREWLSWKLEKNVVMQFIEVQ